MSAARLLGEQQARLYAQIRSALPEDRRPRPYSATSSPDPDLRSTADRLEELLAETSAHRQLVAKQVWKQVGAIAEMFGEPAAVELRNLAEQLTDTGELVEEVARALLDVRRRYADRVIDEWKHDAENAEAALTDARVQLAAAAEWANARLARTRPELRRSPEWLDRWNEQNSEPF